MDGDDGGAGAEGGRDVVHVEEVGAPAGHEEGHGQGHPQEGAGRTHLQDFGVGWQVQFRQEPLRVRGDQAVGVLCVQFQEVADEVQGVGFVPRLPLPHHVDVNGDAHGWFLWSSFRSPAHSAHGYLLAHYTTPHPPACYR